MLTWEFPPVPAIQRSHACYALISAAFGSSQSQTAARERKTAGEAKNQVLRNRRLEDRLVAVSYGGTENAPRFCREA